MSERSRRRRFRINSNPDPTIEDTVRDIQNSLRQQIDENNRRELEWAGITPIDRDRTGEIIREVPRSVGRRSGDIRYPDPERSSPEVIRTTPQVVERDPIEYSKIKRVLVIGCGGVGANLLYLLVSQGYEVAIIDDDIVEEKNINRLIFRTSEDNDYIGKPKVELAAYQIRTLLKTPIVSFMGRYAEEVSLPASVQTFMSEPYICVCATDNIESRRYIEDAINRDTNCKFFTHIGCNNNSVSIMPSVKGLISEPVNTESSYDQEPTRATYLQCILTVLGTISNSECSVRNEFVQQIDNNVNALEIPTPDRAKGYFKFTYQGYSYIAKGAKIALKKCVLGGRAYFVKPDITRRTESDVIIAYSPRSARVSIFTPTMTPFLTPHTMHFGDQCTGTIRRPRSDSFREIKRFLDELEPSLCIANFDSLANHYFGDFRIDNGALTHEQAIMGLCTPRRPDTVPRVVQGGTAIAQTNKCGFMCFITHFWKPCPHPSRTPTTSNPVPEQQPQPASVAGQIY